MKAGFSLVELSIVLVIIGLLTGGVMVGQHLIRSAELRSITKDIENFKMAASNFRDKYRALPGDMSKATNIWGEAATCPGDHTTPSTDGTTCNGDGNGKISNWMIGSNQPHQREIFRAWQHLANADMVKGTYTGVSDSATMRDVEIGKNIPGSRISSAGYMLGYVLGQGLIYPDAFGNSILFGVPEGPTAHIGNPVLTPQEAWNIDQKSDDGRPGKGNVTSWTTTHNPAPGQDCATSSDPDVAEYELSDDDILCLLVFNLRM